MCEVCIAVKNMSAADAMKLIGKHMTGAKGKKQAHLLELVDELLSVDEKSDDPDLAAEWEHNYRNRGSIQ
ncbi:hypothetical protein UFOVP75_79 [uncultured Caudovirales phage]|uniref:Uncharacterized protein n=1 Tax=uncultured Caudovirales phage TaxID=2100421 RepID=A0A6J5L1S7_9CAUD|nr:hypothetical protein UFOVP75_79 [uncultured Caudovirales phage]